MKKLGAVLLIALLCFSLAGCFLNPFNLFQKDKDPPPAETPPTETPPETELGFKWIVEPQYLFDDVMAINVYSQPGMSGTNYLVFKKGNFYGLLDSSLNVAVEAEYTQVPIICQMDELHLIDQYSASVTYLPLPADLKLAQGEHGGDFDEYIYDYTTDDVYVLLGFEYVPLSEYGTANMPEMVPARYAVMKPDPLMGMAPEYRGDYDFIDRSGRLVTAESFEYADIFCGGFAAVMKNGKYTYVDEKLDLLTEYEFLPSHGEIYVNETNRMISPALSYRFLQGYAVVRTQSGYGVLNGDGTLVVPCEYQKIVPMLGGQFAVKSGNQWGIAIIE